LAEIIVVDNCSSDKTVAVAKGAGADLVLSTAGTISTVRNSGVRRSQGDVLIFLDADVFPTRQWGERIVAAIEAVIADPMLMTGSWVSIPTEATWLEHCWFAPLQQGSKTHINSGHMIISRKLFDRLTGFNELLRSGEDFDLSTRAIKQGARLVDDPRLKVAHEGYPKSVGEFFRREMWHGIGDFQSCHNFLRSKVAIVGVALFHLLIFGVFAAAIGADLWWLSAALFIILFCGVSAACIRYRKSRLLIRLVNSALYSMYFLARGCSLYAALFSSSPKRAVGSSRH